MGVKAMMDSDVDGSEMRKSINETGFLREYAQLMWNHKNQGPETTEGSNR